MRTKVKFLFFILLAPSCFYPQLVFAKAQPLSIREAIMLALRFNPDIKNAEIDRITQKFRLHSAYREFEWQYTLGGNANYTRSKIGGIRQPNAQSYNIGYGLKRKNAYGTDVKLTMDNTHDGDHYNPKLTLEIDQPLARGSGKNVVQRQLHDALDDEDSNKLSLKETIITTIRRVITSYRRLIQSNNNVITAKNSLGDALEVYKNNKLQIKYGRLPRTINIQHEAQIERLKIALVRAINTQNRDELQLLDDIGLDPNTKIIVPSNVQIEHTLIPDVTKMIKYALAHNIPYQKNLILFRKNKRQLMIAHDTKRWQLDLKATVTTGGGVGGGKDADFRNLFNGRNQSQSVMLTWSIPVDDIGLETEVVASSVQLEKDKNSLNDDQRKLTTAIKNQIRDIKSALQQVKISEQSVKIAEQNYKLEQKKQQVGRATALDVTNTQNELIVAQIDLIFNKITYLESVSTLHEILGNTLDIWGIKLRY